MSCKKFCFSQKVRLTEDSEWLQSALEIFLRAHRLLKNFIDFFRFHGSRCCGVNYDAVPLRGALDIVPVAMTSIICGNVLKKGSQRPGLFHDIFPCVRCRDVEDLPEDIVRKVDVILACLQKSCHIENIIRQIKDVLCTLEKLTSRGTFEKLQMLSLLLNEIIKKLICIGQRSQEPLSNTQTKLTLNLVNNFIRDWSEKKSGTRPCLSICRFCDRVISQTTRQWGMFCCKEAQQFNSIRKEWALRQSISYLHRDEPSDWEIKSTLPNGEQFSAIDEDSRTHASVEKARTIGVTDRREHDAESSDERGSGGGRPAGFGRTSRHRSAREISATRRLETRVFSKKTEVERYEGSIRGRDKFDRVEDRDLTKKAGRTLDGEARGEIKRSRNIGGTGEYPIRPDGREKRDDVPYKSKLDEIRGSRGLRDTSEKRTAVGKMRKIKSDARYSRRDRLERAGLSETESEGDRIGRARGEKKSASVRMEKSTAKETSRRGGRRLYRNTLADGETERRVGKSDADNEERTTDRRRRKKPREEDDAEVDEAADARGKEVGRRRKKKRDRVDGEEKEVSYSVDEEGKVLKRDGKRRDRSRGEGDETDSELTKKRGGVKHTGSSAEDKSTLDSEGQDKKGTSASSKKGRRRTGSSRTDDDYSKTNGSRYRKRKTAASKLYDVASGDRSSIEYQLSNQHFVKLGWTVLPVAKTMRKIVRYEAKPAKPHLDWFKKYKHSGRMYYDDGFTVFVNFLADGSAEVFYPNGTVAIKLQRPRNRKYDMYTVFSPGGKDCMGVVRKSQIVAVFDTIGNGTVFDEDGATRLSYNQIAGIWRDNPAGVPLIWKWDIYEKESITKIVHVEKPAMHLEKLLYPLTKTILKSSGSAKASTSPASSRNKEKKVEEQKPVGEYDEEEEVESGRDIYQNCPEETYHFKTICFNLNDRISLRILNRSNISLKFHVDKKIIKIELGTILNLNNQVESYFVDSSSKDGVLKCKFEKLLPSRLKSDSSMHDIAEEFTKVKKSARQRKFMMNKYRPYLRAWKMSGTRCRPR